MSREKRNKLEKILEVYDVADAYIIQLMYRRLEDKSLAHFRLYEIQQNYLEVFRDIMANQLDYYIRTNRIDSTFQVFGKQPSVADFVNLPVSKFPSLFAHTHRHDQKRINDNWVDVADKLVKLEQAKEYGIFTALDVLNHTIHNGGGYIITKLDNGMKLYKVIQIKMEDNTVASERLLSYGSREIRAVYKETMV